MDPASSIVAATDSLIERARRGDEEAWTQLFEKCYPKIVRAARRKLNRPTGAIGTSSDIANEVLQSLAVKFSNIDIYTINGLQAFLIKSAERKVADELRHHLALKRGGGLVRPLGDADDTIGLEHAASGPTPSQVVVASEEKQLILDKSGENREVVEMKLTGMNNAEVAENTGWDLRKVQRFFKELRGTLRR